MRKSPAASYLRHNEICPYNPSFFFPSYCHHPDLHSFPTRRSSDLSKGQEDITRGSAVLRRAQAQQEIREAKKQENSPPGSRIIEVELRPLELETRSNRMPPARPGDLVRNLKLVYRRVGIIVEISADREESIYGNGRHLRKSRVARRNAEVLIADLAFARQDSRVPRKVRQRFVHKIGRQGGGELQRGDVVSEFSILAGTWCARHKEACAEGGDLGIPSIEIALGEPVLATQHVIGIDQELVFTEMAGQAVR